MRRICRKLWLGLMAVSLSLEAGAFSDYPPIYTALDKLSGVSRPVLSLDGDWQFRFETDGPWEPVQVPGELVMQGFGIRHDTPYRYRKTFDVPSDYEGSRIILRFDGVYGQAKLYVNGRFVREHHGGFTRWDSDVTDWVTPGTDNTIEVEVTDRLDDISYASGYAHHPIGGILRNVSLLAQPRSGFSDFYLETTLDSLYQDAVLRVNYRWQGTYPSGTLVRYELRDPRGKRVPLKESCFVPDGSAHLLPVLSPDKWDAEHQNLYTLIVSVEASGKEVSRFQKQVGFREVKVSGDRLLVNGRPVKLRGACRHDVHPLLGRTTTPSIDSLDAVLFRDANMNFVRTSHYPPSEKFVEYCDRFGIYVECETAVCFVDTYRQKNYAPGRSQDDPAFLSRYLSQCQEMVQTFRSHPSVLFWSLGNESRYGANIGATWEWVKETDTTRPVIFSYPGSVTDTFAVDILSMHYPGIDGNLSQWDCTTKGFQGEGIPALFDEWAHPACYTYQTLQTDPNIREFWGQSLDKMWSNLFDAPGGLGGAIWGYVDETFSVPPLKYGTSFWKEFAHTAKPLDMLGDCVGYGEWGIVDVWRRKKPEFWATKKAYSPIRLDVSPIEEFEPGKPLSIDIRNRFDHTDLNELRAFYVYDGKRRKLSLPSVAPHEEGILTVPSEKWSGGSRLQLAFFTSDYRLIDSFELVLGREETIDFPLPLPETSLTVQDTEDSLIVRGDGFEIPFSKSSGLICNAKSGETVLLERGPFLNAYVNYNHLSGAEVRKIADHFVLSEENWSKEHFEYKRQGEVVTVSLRGRYGDVTVDFTISITPFGLMRISYDTDGLENGFLRETGLTFYLSDAFHRLSWKRDGYWSCYEEDSFAGNTGDALLYESCQAGYREAPEQPWWEDTHEYYYWSDAGSNCQKPLTRKSKGMKEHIWYYTLSDSQGAHSFSVISEDASVACRLNKNERDDLKLHVNNRWDYPEIAWGNYCKMLEALPCKGELTFQFR